MPNLVDIGPVDLEKKFDSDNVLFLFIYYILLIKRLVLNLNFLPQRMVCAMVGWRGRKYKDRR